MGDMGDMLYKMKYNQSLRKNNRSNYNKYRDAIVTYKKSKLKIDNENISKEEIESIKKQVRNEIAKRNRVAIIITIFMITLIAVLLIWGMTSFLNYDFYFL